MKLTWLYKASGADVQLIERCPRVEKNNYICMGTLILLISAISFITLSYMLFEIDQQGWESWDARAVIFSISLIWSLIVYNIFRLIISSAGYGDGTSRMRVAELISAIVPWVVAVLLGLCFANMLAVLLVSGNSGYSPQVNYSLFYRLANVWDSYPVIVIITSIFGTFLYSLPIILKLIFWRKGPYDYLVEFQHALTLANEGITPKTTKFIYKNKTYYKARFLRAEEELHLKMIELGVIKDL